MAVAALSEEDFNQLQNQLIEQRTINYDLGSKLRKIESENTSLQEKCNGQEKEIQKLSKIMKFPGFNAITKSKSKKDLAELIEENERLNQQMQRYEDDFKLQNQTLLQEVSRLSSENDELQKKLSTLTSTDKESGDYRRLQAENAVLQETIQDLKSKSGGDQNVNCSPVNKLSDEEFQKTFNNIYFNIENQIKNFLSTQKNVDNSKLETTDTDTGVTDSAVVNTQEHQLWYSELRKRFDESITDIKALISTNSSYNNSGENENLKLETALKETRLLEEKLKSIKEASKVEVQQLREEVGKWSEKTKKKQESFVKLQEEKERMYKENQKQQENLKEELKHKEQEFSNKVSELEVTINSMKSDSKVDDLLGKVDILRNENQAMQSELISLKEKHRIDQSERIKELSDQVQEFRSQNNEYENKIQELSTQDEESKKTISQLTNENESLKGQLNQANELAEKRKKLLDQSMVERQHDVENHQHKLEELKQNYEQEMKNVVTKNNEGLEDLKGQITNHKKLKKELEDARQKITMQQEEIESILKKSGWLERTLKETEETLENTKKEKENDLNETNEKHEQERQILSNEHEQKIEEFDKDLKALKESKEDQVVLIEKLKQATKDKEVEYRVANKKTDHLLKDLKRQLNNERKRADQLQLKLQDFIQDIKVKHTYDEIFNPESLQLKVAAGHKRHDSGSHISIVSSMSGAEIEDGARNMKTSSPVQSSTNLSGLSDETMDLISRLTDLQGDKWILEEKVRHLEENGAMLTDDLMQKTLIIQNYVMESKGVDTTAQRARTLTLKEKIQDKLKLNNNEDLQREINSKMQLLLEETLARNVQLQQDVDLLSKELHNLKHKT